jgi:diguanylate cyclase (GGDEF)-like protein
MDHQNAMNSTPDPIRPFLRAIIAVVAVAVVATVGLTYLRTASLLRQSALAEARSFTDLIITTRSWNASHGGVWVLKGPGVGTNPFLTRLGVSADATATDGRVFTLRNPSLMTGEISEMLRDSDGAVFHLTSLKPIDPRNVADAWEHTSLEAFAAGAPERWTITPASNGGALRYMRPLVTEKDCLRCHGVQGYKVGDIRGAISVVVPMADMNRQATANIFGILFIGVLATAVLLWFTITLTRRLRRRLADAQAALVRAAATDALTGLANRREVLDRLGVENERARREGGSIGVLMLDIDHFKAVNDIHGHAAGDDVLVEIAARLSAEMRPYDVVGRIGGEEFLIVAPGSDLPEAAALAERVRSRVASEPLRTQEHEVAITISIGVTVTGGPGAEAIDRTLARADAALYAAKEAGRNRVVAREDERGMTDAGV